MNPLQEGNRAVLDRTEAEAVLARVAVATFTYYPDKPEAEPGYTLREDVDWAVEPMAVLEPVARERWMRRVAEVITEPTVDRRQAFLTDLMALTDE